MTQRTRGKLFIDFCGLSIFAAPKSHGNNPFTLHHSAKLLRPPAEMSDSRLLSLLLLAVALRELQGKWFPSRL